ncbi:uncharacterized protein LOC132705922 [Cylas formicarius]|uniref:uncharacterized protein LOC132705922 n=1 Tax=Cylas formicarius TaxID=197179 RepID=UPI002958971B|nr:uncharacterized protein LOC132705922 [Cylas formicarius]
MKMNVSRLFAVLVTILGVQQMVIAKPYFISRVKRVSDPHLADLETKLALGSKIKGFAFTLPVAAGKDLDKIGRKRRSQSRLLDVLFNQSEEDTGEPLMDYQDTPIYAYSIGLK